MAGQHLAVVTASRKKMHGKKGGKKHAHPVRSMTISPTDNNGFTTETEMHPKERISENDPYTPPERVTGAHANGAQMLKHVKAMLLKGDSEEQGPGEGEGGDPGSAEEAE